MSTNFKSLRSQSRASAASHLKSVGGARSAHGARCYADGGSVAPMSAKMPMAKSSSKGKSGGKSSGKGKKGTNVNVIVMGHPKDAGAGAGGPPPPDAMPPMPPPGPGGPPMGGPPPPGMPMRKAGGRVKAFKKGGRVKGGK